MSVSSVPQGMCLTTSPRLRRGHFLGGFYLSASHSCNPRSNTTLGKLGPKSQGPTPLPPGSPGHDSDRIARLPAPSSSLPPRSLRSQSERGGSPGCESPAPSGPALFVAAANGRSQNIGGCPGDSVICHRITFENGTWNETTAAAPPSPGPGPEAAPAFPAARRGSAAMRPTVRR